MHLPNPARQRIFQALSDTAIELAVGHDGQGNVRDLTES
jgi:hypothetical protein